MCLLLQRRRRAKEQAGWVDYFLEVPLILFFNVALIIVYLLPGFILHAKQSGEIFP